MLRSRPMVESRRWTGLSVLSRAGGIVAVFGLLGLLAHWGGTPQGGPLFWLGVAVLATLMVSIGLVTWWLFGSRIADVSTEAYQPSVMRQVIAVLGLVSTAMFVTGFVWDEVWHRSFGRTAVESDFLWAPHKLIYGSLALFAFFCIGGLVVTLRGRGRGGLRARFRRDPLIGLMAIAATYLMISFPSDLLWHQIYGVDLTAWSLPHIFLALGVASVILIAAALALSLDPDHSWTTVRGIPLNSFLALPMLALMAVVLIQFGTTEWDGITKLGSKGGAFRDAFWQRPIWLYPVVVATISVFSAHVALYMTRRVGAATAAGVLVVAFRVVTLVGLSNTKNLTAVPHLSLLAACIALDAWYAVRGPAARTAVWQGALIAGGATLAVNLPLVDAGMIYPPLTAYSVPRMVGYGLVMSLVAGLAGSRLATLVMSLDPQRGAVTLTRRAVLATAAGVTVALAYVALIVLTATPPV